MLAFGIIALVLISFWAKFAIIELIKRYSNIRTPHWKTVLIFLSWLLGFGVPIAYIAMTLGRL